jgi:putative molybdopterin biosynthesis protein
VALGLDFVPLANEPYELAMLARSLDEPRIAELVTIVASAGLRAEIDALPGYDATAAGTTRYVDP